MSLFKKDRLQDVLVQEATKEQAKQYHVLVVDDEPDNVRVLTNLLDNFYFVSSAASGVEALSLVNQGTAVDLIISDQRMPKMTGVEFLNKTRTIAPFCIRMLLTGYTDVEAIIAAVNEGQVYRYMTKPWDTRELLMTVRLALEAYEAHRKSRRKSEFLANTAHELRTPLNAIIGYSDLLIEQDKELGHNNAAADLERINAAAHQLLSLINELLDFSKIEAGKVELFCESFEVAALLRDVAAMMHPIVAKNENDLEVQSGQELGSMHADMIKVRQVLYNLLSNASKFTKQGKITLEAKQESRNGIDWIIFRVRDTGVGMTEEQVQKLFQAYKQADRSTSAKFGGTGLGLVISKQLCELMQGCISVESDVGVGTTFTARLPKHVEDEKTAKKSAGGDV